MIERFTTLETGFRLLARAFVAAALVEACCGGSASAQTATAGPLGFQINTAHTGYVQTAGVKPPLKVRWKVGFPAAVSYPIVANGAVYVVGGNPSALYALNATTGRALWKRNVPSSFGNLIGAAYENGKLFVVPTGGVSGGGAMFAYDALSGKELWSANLPGQYSFSSAPTAYAGVVYTGGAGSGGTVYAVRETDGLLLWTGSVENGDSSAPAVTPDGVFVSYACPQTYRFALHSGKLDWNYSGPCEGGGGESAAVYRGQVYVRDVLGNYSTDGIRLAESTGALLGGFNSTYSPAFEGLTAFYTEPNTLTALNLVTGHARWTAVAPAGQQFSCAPIVVNDAIYEATAGSELYGYNIDTGRMLFAAALPQAVTCSEYFSTPLVGLGAGDGILVVPAGDFLIAFD